jgi:HD superfamily phosphohydrolase
MHVATRAFEAINQSSPGLLGEADELGRNRQLLRLAALLHDLGHPPFSHAAETLFPKEPATGRRYRHEDYTEAIVSKSEVGDRIDSTFSVVGINRQSVIDVFKDPASLGRTGILLQDLVAGELDADRMDYLARDSLYAGVAYGRYDLERLLDSIVAIEHSKGALHLAVEDGGLYALEAFILARYYMFLQVYLHEDRRFYDLALTKVLENCLPGGKYPDPSGWEEYLESDDINVLQAAATQSRAGDPWAGALVNRQHWKVASTLDESDETLDAVAWTNAQRDTVERFGEDMVAVDDARARTFQRTGPRPYITRQADPEERPQILVLDK